MLKVHPALCSLPLYLACLQMPGGWLQVTICSLSCIHQVDGLLNIARNTSWWASSLYTPREKDYMTCPIATLSCFSKEFEVLEQEWMLINVWPRNNHRLLSLAIGALIKRHSKGELDCRSCELNPAGSAVTFLTAIKNTLMMMCNPRPHN